MRGDVEDLTEAVAAEGLKKQHETIAIIIPIEGLEWFAQNSTAAEVETKK